METPMNMFMHNRFSAYFVQGGVTVLVKYVFIMSPVFHLSFG